ncbi:MAG TPA: NUDIX hydrolase [Candidatus Saccharimonadales bacterium]
MRDDHTNDWQTLSSEDVYETPWIKVRRDEVVTPSKKHLTYSVVALQHPFVIVVAVNDNDEILIQRNFRYPIGKYSWDLPAGHSDGEDLLFAAKRELLEETGLASDDWTDLGELHEVTGIGDIPGKAFLARNVRLVSDERDEAEDIIEQKFLSQSALEDFIRQGKIDEGAVIAALYLARLHMS